VATKITGDSKEERRQPKLSISNITSAFKSVGANISQKFSQGSKVTFGRGLTGTSSPLTSGTDPSKITDSLNETNRILVEIQKQLSIDFANRIVEEKDRLKANRTAVNAQKRTDKENRLETKWLRNTLGSVGKGLQRADTALGTALLGKGKGGLFGTLFKGIALLGAGIIGAAAWKFFQNPDNLKRLNHLFNNLGTYLTKGWEWLTTTWTNLKPKLDLLMSLPFNNMEEAKVWIQNAVMEIFPEWIRGIGNATNTTVEATSNAVTATYNAGRETRRWVDDSLLGMTGRDLGGIFGGVADWILRDSTDLDRLGYSKGGYTGSRGGIVHPHEFVMNNDAVNKWGTNLLSSMNEGRAPLEALISNQALQLGKVPKRMVIQEIDLPAITKRREPSAKLSNAPVASVPSFSSINPLNGDMVKAPIHYGFAEFI
jgi:hypothetical protein